MAFKWSDVEASDKYKSAAPELQLQIQDKYFETQVKTAPGFNSKWEPEIKNKLFGRPLPSNFLYDTFVRPAKSAFGGFELAFAKSMEPISVAYDWYADSVTRATGLGDTQKKRIVETLKDTYLEIGSRYSKDGIQPTDAVSKFQKALYSGLGSAAWQIPEFALATKYLPMGKFIGMGIVSGVKATPEGAGKAAEEFAKGTLLQGIIRASSVLPWQIQVPTNTVLFGGMAAQEQAQTIQKYKNTLQEKYGTLDKVPDEDKQNLSDLEDAFSSNVIASGVIGGGLSAFGRSPSMEQFLAPYKQKQYMKEAALIQQSQELIKASREQAYEKGQGEARGVLEQYGDTKVLEAKVQDLIDKGKIVPLERKSIEQFNDKGQLEKQDIITPVDPKKIVNEIQATWSRQIARAKNTRSPVKLQTPEEILGVGEELPAAGPGAKPAAQTTSKTTTSALPVNQGKKSVLEPPSAISKELPLELTKGEHLFTPEQALEKSPADMQQRWFDAQDVLGATVRGPVNSQIAALSKQLVSLKGQRGPEITAAKKDLTDRLEELKGIGAQAEEAVQEEITQFQTGIANLAIQEAQKQGLDLGEVSPDWFESGNISEEWGNFRDELLQKVFDERGYVEGSYRDAQGEKQSNYNRPIKEIIQETIDEFKQDSTPEAQAKKAQTEAQRLAIIDEKIAKDERITPKGEEPYPVSKKEFVPEEDIFYHGTPHGKIEEFDIAKRGTGADQKGFGDYGNGFYFSRDFKTAQAYATGLTEKGIGDKPYVVKAKLDIKKPLDLSKLSKYTSEIGKKIKERGGLFKLTDQDYLDILKNSNLTEEEYEFMKDIEGYVQDNFGDFDIGSMLKAKGYDAIYSPDGEVVVFDKSQIKLSTPTGEGQIKPKLEKTAGEEVADQELKEEAKRAEHLAKKADANYKLVGYYDKTGYSEEKDVTENGNLMPGKKLKKDIVKFAKALKEELGWNWYVDKKGKTVMPDTNVGPWRGGNASILLFKPGSIWGIYISIDVDAVNGDDLEIGGTMGKDASILYRATEPSILWSGASNNFAPWNISVGELAKLIQKNVSFHEPGNETTKSLGMGVPLKVDEIWKRANDSEKYGMQFSLLPVWVLNEFKPSHSDIVALMQLSVEYKPEGIEKEKIKEKVKAEKPLTEVKENAILKSEIKETENVQATDDLRPGLPGTVGGPSGSPASSEPSQVSDTQRQQQSVKSRVERARSAQYNQESDEEKRKANLGNYRITSSDLLGAGSPKEKYKSNILAIKLLKKIEAENRKATPEEQAVLVRYVGWGGLSKALDKWNNKGWEKENEELTELLTSEEYSEARASTINAHYTSQDVIRAMWQAVLSMGFEKGKVLEPAMGIGHFIGLRPEGAKIAFTGVELDDLTGRIAKQLYQNGDVQIKGFQDATLSRNFYDLAISNVPFADIKPFDPKAKELGIPAGLNLHDYFFAKSLALVKPGGVIAFITSKGTMDKQDTRVRAHLASQADLLGAIRLPNTAFKANAGTEVTTDIIFLRKRLPGEQPAGEAWINSTETKVSNRNVNVNEYFIKNTAMVLGNMKVGRGMYSENELTVEPFAELLTVSLQKAIDFLPKNIIKSEADIREEQKPEEIIEGASEVKQGAYVLKNGKIYQKEEDKLVEQNLDANDKARLTGIMQIRDVVRDLFAKQISSDDDARFKPDLERLNSLYDKFVKKYGFLNDSKNETLFWEDPDLTLISSLEKEDKVHKTFLKSEAFSQRVIHHHRRPTHADNAHDALFDSLAEYGHLNWNYMSEITGRLAEDLQKELSDKNIIFKNPEGEKWELKDEYLTGNVKLKLKQAEAAVKVDPAYTKNIAVLREVIPVDKAFNEIGVRLGTPWIETKDYKEFISELLGVSGWNINVEHNITDGRWNLELKSYAGTSANTEQWGTQRYPAINLIEAIANHKVVRVLDKVKGPGGEDTYVLNEQETAVAQDKADILKQKFKDWFWVDEERRTKYVRLYNDNFNTSLDRKYNGEHLTFPGMSDAYVLRKTQKDAIWRAISSRSLLLAHAVGGGKTLIGVCAIMESNRLGLTKKFIVTVPRNTLGQWKREFNKLYPAANILVADERNFVAHRRKKFLAKVATGNWDAVILSDSSNFLISVSDESYQDYVQEQVDEYEALMDRARDLGEKKSVKQLEKSIQKLKERLAKKLDQTKKDATVTFEELGVDGIFVDEADRYKNLAYNTKMENVRGLGDPTGSKRAEDMAMKLRHVRKQGGKVMFATGTPISNTMAEVHVMMKYLQPDLLEEKGLKSFDDWANAFGEVVSSQEVDATGGRYKSVNRFKEFNNIPELRKMLYEVWDVQTASMLEKSGILVKGKNLPLIKGGKALAEILPPSPELQEYIQVLGARADKIKGKRPEKGGDNMLVILHDGIMGSTDMRLIDPNLLPDPNSKIEVAIRGIYESWAEGVKAKTTQIVFIDVSKPDEQAAFNPQWYMKRKLIELGIPEKEIAFIHDFDSMEEKDDLYSKVNNGDIRVLFGSTEKLGAGTNVQERLIDLWHLSTPFRPRDIMQREGRIVRPGNTNKEIRIHRLVTKGSLDTFMWQMLEAKLAPINQVLEGDDSIRTISEEVDEYSIIKAASSDNPLLREKVEVDKEVKRLTNIKNAFLNEKFKSQKTIKELPDDITGLKKRIEGIKADIAKRPEKLVKENFVIEIGGKEYKTKEEAWTALKKAVDNVRTEDWAKDLPVGHYQGFPISLFIYYDATNSTRQNRINVKGAFNYEAVFSDSAIGTFASIDSALYTAPEKLLQNANVRHEEANKHLIIAKAIAEKDFEYQKTLDEKSKRQIEINRLLRSQAEGKEVKEGDDIIEMHSGFIFGRVKDEPVDDNLNTDPATFIDSEVERRFKEAHGQQHPDSLVFKIKQFMAKLWEARKVFPGLPDSEYYAEAKFDLQLQQHALTVARDKTIRNLNAITHKFGNKKLNLFTRAIILADFTQEVAKGRPVPLGYSYFDDEGKLIINSELLAKDKENIDKLVELNPDVKAALERRKTIVTQISNDLVKYKILTKDQVKDDYYRHQVLEYANAKATFGTGKKLKTPTPGYSKRRFGTVDKDINTNYLEAEFEFMSQAIYDIETAKSIDKFRTSKYNIKEDLRKQAQQHNDKMLDTIIVEGEFNKAGDPATVRDMLKPFNSKIGFGFSILAKEGYEFAKDSPGTFEEIAKIAEDEEAQGKAQMAARMILKAIAGRRTFIKKSLGTNYKEWQDMIPEGYTTWQPREGRMFYNAYSIPQRIINEVLSRSGEEIGISQEDIKKLLAVGGMREEFVIPQELADTLNNMFTLKLPNWITDATKAITTVWKKWVLLNPRRAFSYNFQNFLGDADHVIAANPRILRFFNRATQELSDMFYKGKTMTVEMREFFERGGLSTMLTIQELPDINTLETFLRMTRTAENMFSLEQARIEMKKAWNMVVRFTLFRESILRYAAYLHYRDIFLTGGKEYGGSRREDIEGLSDPLDKAAKVATDTLGDYSNISQMMKEARETVLPFGSWLEVNFRIYYNLNRNAWIEGGAGKGIDVFGKTMVGAGGRAAAFTLMAYLSFVLRMIAVTAIVSLYNQLFFSKEESELNPYDQNRMHINLGRDKYGKPRIRRGQGSFADIMEWFGLDQTSILFRDYFEGKASLTDIFGKIPFITGKIGLKPAYLKIMRGITPIFKAVVETTTGKYMPGLDERSGVVEDKFRNILKAWSMENEYDWITKKPSRGYIKSWEQAFITTTDPEENAFRYIQGLKYAYKDKQGKGGSGDFYTPRSIVYRQYKKALLYKDEPARVAAIKEMMKLGVSMKDLERSVKTQEPLSGLSEDEKKDFIKNYISVRDRDKLKSAYRYYVKTFLSSGQWAR